MAVGVLFVAGLVRVFPDCVRRANLVDGFAEFRRYTLRELDFAGWEGLVIPEVFWDHTAPGVLTMERAEVMRGLGGDVTVLHCHVEHADTHMTLNPVAVNYQCWAARRASVHVDAQGNLGVWDRRAVLIQPGAAGIVAEAKSSPGNYVYVAVDEWDYFWTDDPAECVI